jgi:hypothetical protein
MSLIRDRNQISQRDTPATLSAVPCNQMTVAIGGHQTMTREIEQRDVCFRRKKLFHLGVQPDG